MEEKTNKNLGAGEKNINIKQKSGCNERTGKWEAKYKRQSFRLETPHVAPSVDGREVAPCRVASFLWGEREREGERWAIE